MTIFEYLDGEVTVKLDKKFAKKVYDFTKRYTLKDNSISEFYGSQTIGVHPITFKSALEQTFYNDILGVDARDLKKGAKKVKAIIPHRKITGDVFNITLFYLARRIIKENKLPKKILRQCKRDLVMLFCFRSVSALHNKYFSKYLIDAPMGTKILDNMSDLFILKRLGSWIAYMEYRVDKVYDPERNEYKRLMMNNEDAFLSVLIKTQGAIRSTIKAIYGVYLTIKDEDRTGTSRSIAVTINEDSDIADLTTDVPALINKTLNKITSKDVFVNREYISLICSEYVTKFEPEVLENLLVLIHKQFSRPEGIKSLDYIRDVLVYELHIIRENLTTAQSKDPAHVLSWVRGVITSSRSRNELLIDLREQGSDVIKSASKMSNRHYLVKARIALMLYILLLTY